MKIPQKKQKDESQEEYVRRISKFPSLHPDTIQRVVFLTKNTVSHQYLHDWAGLVFPEEFPPPDLDGYPDLYPKNISTKAFAKWVAEENIFEAWRELGEEVTPSAELFIKLVNGKASRNSPHPVTNKAKMNRLRKDYISAAEKMLIKNPNLKWPDFKDSSNLKNLLRESGLPHKESTLQRNWIPKARTKAKVTGKPGAPKKK